MLRRITGPSLQDVRGNPAEVFEKQSPRTTLQGITKDIFEGKDWI